MNESLVRFAALRQILLGMEQDLGLGGLGEIETRVLCAAAQSSVQGLEVPLSAMQQHPLTAGISRSTFFRAMSLLVDQGYLAKAGPQKRAGYIVLERS